MLITKGFVGMVISNLLLHQRLGSFCDGSISYTPRYRIKTNSSIALIAILVAHGIFILIVLNAKSKQSEVLAAQPLLQLIQLRPEDSVPSELEKPDVSLQANSIHFQLPIIHINDSSLSPIDSQSAEPYELSNSNDTKHRDIFDPKLRKKLVDMKVFNVPRPVKKSGSWATSDGRVFTDMGDGRCMVSDPKLKADWRDRGTSYSTVPCGKTDSEQMMDNVNADIEARKNPLNKEASVK